MQLLFLCNVIEQNNLNSNNVKKKILIIFLIFHSQKSFTLKTQNAYWPTLPKWTGLSGNLPCCYVFKSLLWLRPFKQVAKNDGKRRIHSSAVLPLCPWARHDLFKVTPLCLEKNDSCNTNVYDVSNISNSCIYLFKFTRLFEILQWNYIKVLYSGQKLFLLELNERLQCILGVVVCGSCDDYVMKGERLRWHWCKESGVTRSFTKTAQSSWHWGYRGDRGHMVSTQEEKVEQWQQAR